MKLVELVEALPIQIPLQEHWSIFGSEVELFCKKLKLDQNSFIVFNTNIIPKLDGLVLVEALSTTPNPLPWLRQVIEAMPEGTTLLVIDWQDDGPPNYGPKFELRFKKGRLSRLLRESGFGIVETLDCHPVYYILKAKKGAPHFLPQANQFVDVAHLNELPKNAMKKVELFGHKIIVANTGQEIVAFTQSCPHANGPFDKGLLRGRNVVCPLHGYIWNVHSGEPVEPADEDILPRYSVKIDADMGRILVALAPPLG